jgi:hypothetical protein
MPVLFEPILACVQVAIKAQNDVYQNELINVLHFITSGPEPALGDVSTLVNLVEQWCNNAYKQNFSNDFRIVELRGRSMFAAVAPFFNKAVDILGTQGGSDEYAHAPLMLLHGGLTERTEAGRFYAFPPGGVVPQTGYSAAYYTNMLAALINLSSVAHFAGYELGVGSRKASVCFPALSFSHSNRLTMQTRRRPLFGR